MCINLSLACCSVLQCVAGASTCVTRCINDVIYFKCVVIGQVHQPESYVLRYCRMLQMCCTRIHVCDTTQWQNYIFHVRIHLTCPSTRVISHTWMRRVTHVDASATYCNTLKHAATHCTTQMQKFIYDRFHWKYSTPQNPPNRNTQISRYKIKLNQSLTLN